MVLINTLSIYINLRIFTRYMYEVHYNHSSYDYSYLPERLERMLRLFCGVSDRFDAVSFAVGVRLRDTVTGVLGADGDFVEGDFVLRDGDLAREGWIEFLAGLVCLLLTD